MNVSWLPMNLSSNHRPIERARPWLGTLVSIRVEGLVEQEAHRALDAAFLEVATVHRLMSFHDPESDVSRLNRDAASHPVTVHPWTYSVLEQAQWCSQASEGCFDVSVGAELVQWNLLGAPLGAAEPRGGTWKDIELLPTSRVVFRSPLWIDLGGIAKGYAVDRAIERLCDFGPARVVVNAGGDIRVRGTQAEPIRLGAASEGEMAPVLELADGSAAGSRSGVTRGQPGGNICGPHVDGSRRTSVAIDRFVCVVAERCITADALTKVVMARGERSAAVIEKYGASAYIKDPLKDWQHIGTEETGTR